MAHMKAFVIGTVDAFEGRKAECGHIRWHGLIRYDMVIAEL